MEGTPADLTIYIDSNVDHDRTYYGNGCFGIPGSTTPCGSRIVATFDSENLEIGTYYQFQSSTSGAGGTSLSTDNAIAPDTFCPLGWQLPYGGTDGDYYDKSRSWINLFGIYHYGNNDVDAVMSYPISEIKSGNLDFYSGYLNRMGQVMNHWTIATATKFRAYKIDVWGGNLLLSISESKPLAYPIRCDHFFDIR